MDKNAVYTPSAPKARPTTAVEIVDYILTTGVRLKASDIHIGMNQSPKAQEPYLLRFRVHGKLQNVKADMLSLNYREIVSRIKVLAEMKSSDVGVPQDGRINLSVPEGQLALRVATVPCLEHEEVVIRIQRSAEKIPTLEQLGMSRNMLSRVQALVRQKSGMIVLNGPAGSGKTTTIYSMLGSIAAPEKKIITAEDPIETRLPFITHTQVTPKLSFADLARSFMRQDSEVIFIGEIRDAASAEIAIQLAQTGHLVLTTLHTRDAIGVIKRLEALGIPLSFVATSLIGSLSQRLVPRLCAACRVAAVPEEGTRIRLNRLLTPGENSQLYMAGPGCAKCIGGYDGRIPIYELLTVDQEIAEHISRGTPRGELLRAARAKGMMFMAEEALLRAYSGLTDLDSIQNLITAAETFGV